MSSTTVNQIIQAEAKAKENISEAVKKAEEMIEEAKRNADDIINSKKLEAQKKAEKLYEKNSADTDKIYLDSQEKIKDQIDAVKKIPDDKSQKASDALKDIILG